MKKENDKVSVEETSENMREEKMWFLLATMNNLMEKIKSNS